MNITIDAELENLVRAAAERHGLPPRYFARLSLASGLLMADLRQSAGGREHAAWRHMVIDYLYRMTEHEAT